MKKLRRVARRSMVYAVELRARLGDAAEEDGREGGEHDADGEDLADERHLLDADRAEEEGELRAVPEALRVPGAGTEHAAVRELRKNCAGSAPKNCAAYYST